MSVYSVPTSQKIVDKRKQESKKEYESSKYCGFLISLPCIPLCGWTEWYCLSNSFVSHLNFHWWSSWIKGYWIQLVFFQHFSDLLLPNQKRERYWNLHLISEAQKARKLTQTLRLHLVPRECLGQGKKSFF